MVDKNPRKWTFDQNTGQLCDDKGKCSSARSGHDDHQKPGDDKVKSKGPMPTGNWTVDRCYKKTESAPYQRCYVTPDKGTNAHGRTALQVHGPGRTDGCIATDRANEFKKGDKITVTRNESSDNSGNRGSASKSGNGSSTDNARNRGSAGNSGNGSSTDNARNRGSAGNSGNGGSTSNAGNGDCCIQ